MTTSRTYVIPDPTIIWNDLICQVCRGSHFYENASCTFDKKTDMADAGGASQEESVLIEQEWGIPDLLIHSISGTDVFNIGLISRINGFSRWHSTITMGSQIHTHARTEPGQQLIILKLPFRDRTDSLPCVVFLLGPNVDI